MNANSVDCFDLKTGALKLVDNPSKRRRGIGAWEDVLVHEEAPDKVLVLPRFPKTRNLEEEDAVIIQHVINLSAKAREVANADVLGHFEACDLVVSTFRHRDVAVVHAEDFALLFRNPCLAHGAVAPGRLVAAQGDPRDMGPVQLAGKTGERSPAAANVQDFLAGLETNFFADDGHLVVLQLLEGLLLVDIRDDARGVNHARTEEPTVEVVATIIMIPNLLFVCTTSPTWLAYCQDLIQPSTI